MILTKWRLRRADDDTIEATVFNGEIGKTLQNVGVLRLRIGEWQLMGAALSIGSKQMGGHLGFLVEGESAALAGKEVEEEPTT